MRDSSRDGLAPQPGQAEPPPTPRTLGPYRLQEQIGCGAIAAVYRASHVTLGDSVAIKVLHPELAWEPAHVARFVAEAQIVSSLSHPHIVEVTDGVHDPGDAPWLVMELLEGCDLGDLLARHPLPLGRSLEITLQVCDALSAVHSAGIVHHDVKPQNLFVTTRDGLDFVKLIDFGVAQVRAPGSGQRPANPVLIGTPQYMAPEQARLDPVDHRADLYAVGVVLFEAVTGAPPFCTEDDDVVVLLRQVIEGAPPVPSEQVQLPAAVRDDLDGLIGSCLAKDPNDRPPSAQAIAGALQGIMAHLPGFEPRVLSA